MCSQGLRIKVAPGGGSCRCMGLRWNQLCFVTFHTCFHGEDDLKFTKHEVIRDTI